MTTAHAFPSIEKLMVAWLPAQIGGVHVLTELPHDFQTVNGPTGLLPVVALDRISGADLMGSPILDRPVFDVDCYAGSRDDAQTLAERVRYALRWVLPGTVVDGVVVTRVRTVIGPRQLAHANIGVRRYSASYEAVLHPQP